MCEVWLHNIKCHRPHLHSLSRKSLLSPMLACRCNPASALQMLALTDIQHQAWPKKFKTHTQIYLLKTGLNYCPIKSYLFLRGSSSKLRSLNSHFTFLHLHSTSLFQSFHTKKNVKILKHDLENLLQKLLILTHIALYLLLNII